MFERFTERSRKVVVLGQDEARRLRHAYIGTEHLLLGLLLEAEGVAAQALEAIGVTVEGAREQVEGLVGYGEDPTGSQAPFTRGAKKALELSLSEALQLWHNYIGTEHLLLGLLRENGELTRRVLGGLDVEPGAIRREVMGRVGGRPRTREVPSALELMREVLRKSFGRYSRTDRSLFGLFNESGRQVVVLSQDEARHLNHGRIGTEHLLLGLLREDAGIGARALGTLGVRLDEARGQVESIVGDGGEETGGRAPLTPRAKKVLQLAAREARQLGDDHVGGEHVLLGLVRDSEGVAVRVLSHLGVDPDAVRREVVRRHPVGVTEPDSLDEIELPMEEEETGRGPFRGRVKGVRAELALPRPLTVSVDADYVYRTTARYTDPAPTVEPGDVADLLRAGSEEMEAPNLEAVLELLGGDLLAAFPAMLEATVTVSGVPEPPDQPAPTFSVSSTFRR